MDNENNKDMENEETEQKFKDAVFEAFAAKTLVFTWMKMDSS